MDLDKLNNKEDEETSDSDSSDLEEADFARVPDLQNKVTPSDQYKSVMLEEERDIEKAVEHLPETTEIDVLTEKIDVLRQVYFGKSSYQDITPLFIDGAPFMIDSSSLVACAIRESNYNNGYGGQTLHFVYICEKIIQLLGRKGGTCEVVFFKEKSKVWHKTPSFSLAENVMLNHLKNNTQVLIHKVDSITDPKFHQYIMEVQPNFIVLDFTFLDCLKSDLGVNEQFVLYDSLFSVYGLICLSLGLYCIDINSLHLGSNSFMSFVKASDSKIAAFRGTLQLFCANISKAISSNIKTSNAAGIKIDNLKTKDVRRAVLLCVAKSLIEDGSLKKKEEIAKAILVYAAVLELLPIKNRCYKSIKSSKSLENIIDVIVRSIDICLKTKEFEGLDYSTVADLWHGKLFVEVLSSIITMEKTDNLGSNVDKLYEDYLLELNGITGLKLQKYPLSLEGIIEKLELEDNKEIFDSTPSLSSISCDFPSFNNELFKRFCGDINTSSNSADDSSNDLYVSGLKNVRWQNTVRLTDELDRITEDNVENQARMKYKSINDEDKKRKLIKRFVDRQKAKHAHYMDMYGSNLEGKTMERRAIVCENPAKKNQKNQKVQKKDKLSKNAAKLIEENNLKKEKKLQEEENVNYQNFKKQYKLNSNSGKSYETNLALINHVITNMKTDLYYGKMMIYKVDVLFFLWEEECKKSKKKEERDLVYLKELFLAIRDLLNCAQKESSLLSEKESAKLGKRLCQLGFEDLAKKCSLPVIDDIQRNVDVSANESHIRFQMVHLGPELLRKIEGDKDLRVEGFIPDQWQRDMFDAIDKRQSALIVAPTSSGKTYASYYCIEKVLRESNDGRVVYVAPTKALVNQVAATIYSRFKGKAGIVYGVLTRDYKMNAFDCQVLVTVPECLEAVFMSPEYHHWTKKLRYAIFDEVHCLTNFLNGITWERCLMMTPCPFLALSATIQNPEAFHSWMQKFERFKKELDPNFGSRVVLIIHSERHNDLVKHVYENNKGLQHIHPVSHLTNRVMNAHEGIPKHIYLAPGEMVELYDVMVAVAGNEDSSNELKQLQPETYFAQFESGFIFRNDAKTYESKLRKILEGWYRNKEKLFFETVMRFRTQIAEYESSNKRLVQFINSIKEFVELLKSKSMLPAIVFSYDREKCEILGQYVTDAYKEEEEKNAPKIKKKPIAAINDDDDFDDREERPLRKNKVKATSGKKEEHRRKLADVDFNPVGLTECDTQYSVRSVVSLSIKDLQYIENRLFKKGLKKTSPEIEMLRRGVGVHHGGVVTILRNTVEMLFRMKFLNVVFATGTLALGVHMPCKTVVILGDSPLLNTLEFHQISGRAGRRGFDKTGDVVFFGLDSKKVQSLQTSKLPKINGNYPLTVTTILRFLCLHALTKSENEKDVEKEKLLVLNRILIVLNESLLFQEFPDLKTQMKYYFGFSCHFLISLGILHAETGRIHLLTNLINLLHLHEEGTLAFVYLLKMGFFHKLCKLDANHAVSDEACDTIVLILSYLFTNIPFSKHQISKSGEKTDIKLPCLPTDAIKALQSYNNIVKRSYTRYYKSLAKFNVEKFGVEEKLPISRKAFKGRSSAKDFVEDDKDLASVIASKSVSNSVCSVFAGLSGQTDNDLYIENALIGNVREEVFSNYKCIPLVELNVPLNAYAYNFYKHGIIRPIIRDFHLKPGQDYTNLLDFNSILKHISKSLGELQLVNNEDGKDVLFGLRKTFNYISETFDESFRRAYY